jgi:hypothetical protein
MKAGITGTAGLGRRETFNPVKEQKLTEHISRLAKLSFFWHKTCTASPSCALFHKKILI